ncbi:MAG: 30S ribosome-binding factor RbfA [Arsenophonus sp.]
MVREVNRIQRIAKEIQKEIAIIIHKEIKDPRVKMITISLVKISRDLTYAKIFVTFLNILDKENKTDIIKNGIQVLNGNMAKYIRSLLSKSMRLRIIPKLTFFYDSSLIEGMYMTNLVNDVIRSDKNRCNLNKDNKKISETTLSYS